MNEKLIWIFISLCCFIGLLIHNAWILKLTLGSFHKSCLHFLAFFDPYDLLVHKQKFQPFMLHFYKTSTEPPWQLPGALCKTTWRSMCYFHIFKKDRYQTVFGLNLWIPAPVVYGQQCILYSGSVGSQLRRHQQQRPLQGFAEDHMGSDPYYIAVGHTVSLSTFYFSCVLCMVPRPYQTLV